MIRLRSPEFLGFTDDPVQDILTGLVAYWSFDTSTVVGADVTDLSGNSNTATLQNSPSIVTGHNAQAVSLVSASSQYVSAANSTSLDIKSSDPGLGACTVALWVNFATLPAAGKNPSLFGKHTDVRGYGIYYNGDGNYVAGLFGTTAVWVETPTHSPTTGTWIHYVTSVDPVPSVASHARLYVNGVEISPPGTFWGGAATTCTAGPILGRHYSSGAYGYLNGLIDEVRVYNRALTAAQISYLAAL